MKTATKKDVSDRIQKKTGEKEHVVDSVLNAAFESLREIMLAADPEVRIEIREFGVFTVKAAKAKPQARNPKTGEVVAVPAHRKTHFKPGKILKEFMKQPIK